MAKRDQNHGHDKAARKARKLDTERRVNDKVDAELSKLPPLPRTKPSKKKGRYSGMDLPEPTPALLDLVHSFLKDFKYIKAAHGMRTDNQERPGHNMSIWKGTSDNLPSLLEIYLEWERQNLGPPQPQSPGQRVTKSVKVVNESDDSDGDDSDASSEYSEDAMSVDESESPDQPIAPAATTSLKRKASELSISSLSSSESESAAASKSASDAESSSDSSSESESESDGPPASKKRKFGDAPPPPVTTKVTRKKDKRDSESEDDSDSSGSSSDSEDHGSKIEQAGIATSVHTKAVVADDDDSSDHSSSSSDESDESDGDAPAKPLPSNLIERRDSDTSATLPLPASQQGSDLDSSSSSSSDSESDNESDTYGTNATTGEVLVFDKPLSKKAAGRGETAETNIIPATTQNAKRLKMENVPFSRIPADIKVDPKFASNKYQPYDYAERAHQDLIVTKGKGFTKEKNKKKRGSYRGGMIDTSGGKGVKFDD